MPDEPVELTAEQARQGVTGHGARYVLGYSLAFAVAAMIVAAMVY